VACTPKEISIMRLLSALAVPSLLLVTVLSGCRVTSHKNGDSDNVNIGTPFGSMQVKTNDNVEASGIGITPYPGAVMVKKDKDNGAADVNMSFGSFHLGVKAASFTTPDSTDKVLAFYRKDLGRYGVVLECNGKHSVGDPGRTAEGLTCDFDDSSGGHISWDTDVDKATELRTGSKQRQHIVAVQTKDGATKIGMVSLDLPTGLSDHKDKEKESD
jgi:hypothetical protein